MQPRKFEHFLKHLAALTRRQRERLLGLLLPSVKLDVASRYLDNYPGWRWALDGGRVKTPAALLRAARGIFHT